MRTNSEEIDQIIKETLTQEEAKFYDELDEQNIFQMLGGLFRTKNSFLIILINVVNLIFFGLFIYCVVEFLNTDNTNELLKWGAAGFICLINVGMIKLFLWMQLDKNAILREMKRLELQVAALASKSTRKE